MKSKTLKEHKSKLDTIVYEYPYPENTLLKSKELISIVCPKHGVFKQSVDKHFNSGHNCPKCSKRATLTLAEYKETSKHGSTYEYICDDDTLLQSREMVEIYCREHNHRFKQTVNNHFNKNEGCIYCSGKDSKTIKQRIQHCVDNGMHLNDAGSYRYKIGIDEKTIVPVKEKLDITCLKHGSFNMRVSDHFIAGKGCPKCSLKSKTLKEQVELAKSLGFHLNDGGCYKYKYKMLDDDIVYNKDNIDIHCQKHGWFKQNSADHFLKGCGCPKCRHVVSKGESELLEFVKSCLIEKYGSSPEIITNKSPDFFPNKQHLDIYIPSLKIAFEYNGEYWHSDKFGRSVDYHQNKHDACSYNSVELMVVWESDWKNDKENMKCLVEKFLTNRAGVLACYYKHMN